MIGIRRGWYDPADFCKVAIRDIGQNLRVAWIHILDVVRTGAIQHAILLLRRADILDGDGRIPDGPGGQGVVVVAPA